MNKDNHIVFFGTSDFSVSVFKVIVENGVSPSIIVTKPDKPIGRKKILTSPAVKTWADSIGITCFQPEKLDKQDLSGNFLSQVRNSTLFIVVSYGVILPNWLLEIPKFGAINLHPSLLPKLRGPSPIRTALLEAMSKTGVSIIKLDDELDHGPILGAKEISLKNTDYYHDELEKEVVSVGGHLLAEVAHSLFTGQIQAKEQEHSLATFTKKFSSDDGFIDSQVIFGNPIQTEIQLAIRKTRAMQGEPGCFTIIHSDRGEERVKILTAKYSNNGLIPLMVRPDGKGEMGWEAYLKGRNIVN